MQDMHTVMEEDTGLTERTDQKIVQLHKITFKLLLHKAKLTIQTNTAFHKKVKQNDVVVLTDKRVGLVKYIGPTDFKPGEWFGVALSSPTGKHDGTIGGKTYFRTKPQHGVFVLRDKIFRVMPRTGDGQVQVSSAVIKSIESKINALSKTVKQKDVKMRQQNQVRTRLQTEIGQLTTDREQLQRKVVDLGKSYNELRSMTYDGSQGDNPLYNATDDSYTFT